MVENRFIIVVAGGKGLRMGGEIPKQFMLVGGRPILIRTIENFHQWDSQLQIILVLPKSHQPYWEQLCKDYDCKVPHVIADGGETRFHSVLNGLNCISANGGCVGVHDGVRPFVSHEVLTQSYSVAKAEGAVVPVVRPVETIREVLPDGSSLTRNRDNYRLVQTPQVFDLELLRKAYEQPFVDSFTDDASVVEAYGHKITLIDGNRENIKLTTPEDLAVAESFINYSNNR